MPYKKFNQVFDQLQDEENIKQKIFFQGQIYDAYSLIIDIIKKLGKKCFGIKKIEDIEIVEKIINL